MPSTNCLQIKSAAPQNAGVSFDRALSFIIYLSAAAVAAAAAGFELWLL
jgi:hypothetical protein